MEEQYVDENFEIQTRTKDETQIELEKVSLNFPNIRIGSDRSGSQGHVVFRNKQQKMQ